MTQSRVTFDPFSDEFFDDPYSVYRRMRDQAPVYYDPDGDFYALTRHADVAAAFKDHATFSSSRGMDLATVRANAPQVQSIIFMDPPDHRHVRALLSKAFTPRAVEARRAIVEARIARLLACADPTRFDVVQDFAAIFPMEIIAEVVGVPEESCSQMRRWMDEVMHHEVGMAAMGDAAMRRLIEIGSFYLDLVQRRRREPREDMISQLIDARISRTDARPPHLDDLEIAGFVTLLGGAGGETVTKLIGAAAVVFARNPDQWRLLLDDRSKVPAAVEELLRYEGPTQYLVRYTLRESVFGDVTIPAGKPVFLIGAAANRDPDAFTDPDVFDIDRDLNEAQNLAFGYGVHSCLGAALARMESIAALNQLLDFMPAYEVDWEGCRRYTEQNVVGWSHVPVRVTR